MCDGKIFFFLNSVLGWNLLSSSRDAIDKSRTVYDSAFRFPRTFINHVITSINQSIKKQKMDSMTEPERKAKLEKLEKQLKMIDDALKMSHPRRSIFPTRLPRRSPPRRLSSPTPPKLEELDTEIFDSP